MDAETNFLKWNFMEATHYVRSMRRSPTHYDLTKPIILPDIEEEHDDPRVHAINLEIDRYSALVVKSQISGDDIQEQVLRVLRDVLKKTKSNLLMDILAEQQQYPAPATIAHWNPQYME